VASGRLASPTALSRVRVSHTAVRWGTLWPRRGVADHVPLTSHPVDAPAGAAGAVPPSPTGPSPGAHPWTRVPMASITRRRRRSRYDLLPPWLTARRSLAALAALVVLLVGIVGARTILALGRLFHESPVAVVGDLLHGRSGSSVASHTGAGERITIALYGYGGAGHDGGYLTDSIMVVSIQPRGDGHLPQIAEISIPRDWWVPLDLGNGKVAFGRINEAYEIGLGQGRFRSSLYSGPQGGGQMANATLSRMLGIPIQYYVGVDFTAFKDAVDSIGGIDVVVPHSFTDYRYPHGECDGPHPDCSYTTVHFDAGPQHMDGARALVFARSRESTDPEEGTNFARNRRQQLILTAVKQKVLSIGGLHNLPDLLNALGDHVMTNLQLSDALSLYDLVKDVPPQDIEHVSIDDTNFIYECGYPTNCDAAIEFPYDKTFASLHHYVQNLFPDPAILQEHVPITVVDGSGRGNGADARWAQLLQDIGFAATAGGTVRPVSTTEVLDATAGRGTRTASWLATYFGVSAQPTGSLPRGATGGGTATATGSNAAPPASGSSTGVAGVSPSTGRPAAGGITLVLGADEERAFVNPGLGL
jgi:LCP family protein required for cell wall assembly